jgi:hypothetical protein
VSVVRRCRGYLSFSSTSSSPGTSTHAFRLSKTHPLFEDNALIRASVEATEAERGKPLGAVMSEMRSNNFGPPLFCSGKASFYHLDSRQNKSGRVLDTQWLFPRCAMCFASLFSLLFLVLLGVYCCFALLPALPAGTTGLTETTHSFPVPCTA